jgi:hypothetical protein
MPAKVDNSRQMSKHKSIFCILWKKKAEKFGAVKSFYLPLHRDSKTTGREAGN